MPNQKHTTLVTSLRDRLSYLWLALAIVLLPFTFDRWTIPLAAWLVPIFWLRFLRTQPLLRGILLMLLATVLVWEVELIGMVPNVSGALYILIVFVYCVLYTLPYLIDCVIAPPLQGFLVSLLLSSGLSTILSLNL